MGDFTLRYRPGGVMIEELAVGECTIRQCSLGEKSWWNLWFNVARDTDGVPEVFEVPILPNASFNENGPGGRSWGFADQGGGVWQISPSINVTQSENGDKFILPGPHYL